MRKRFSKGGGGEGCFGFRGECMGMHDVDRVGGWEWGAMVEVLFLWG